jgi:hypothetical protein
MSIKEFNFEGFQTALSRAFWLVTDGLIAFELAI